MLLIISTLSVSCVLSSVFECVRSISRGKRCCLSFLHSLFHVYSLVCLNV